jgi:hypothetical protein
VLSQLAANFGDKLPQFRQVSGLITAITFGIGLVVIPFAMETKGETLPD